MTIEEAINVIEQRCGYTRLQYATALGIAIDALRAQQTAAKLDRSRWEGCICCTRKNQLMAREKHGYRYCEHCGRPLTEEAWAELERRIT